MKKSAASHLRQQEKVNAYFQSQSSYWTNIYTSSDVQGEIYRNRQEALLAWIDSLALAPSSHVLDIGCGAGYVAVALAQRGFCVHAIDSSEAMIEQTRRQASEVGVAERLSVDVGDVYALAFEDGSFDLVVAIGVIPWLQQVELAIQEMARVTKPSGHIALTADNRRGLKTLLDPLWNPSLVPLKRYVKDLLERVGLRHPRPNEPEATFHDRCFIDATLSQIEFIKIRDRTVGFGPFSFFRRPILGKSLGIALHYRLQRLADRNVPGLRSMGAHYLVLAKKQISEPF